MTSLHAGRNLRRNSLTKIQTEDSEGTYFHIDASFSQFVLERLEHHDFHPAHTISCPLLKVGHLPGEDVLGVVCGSILQVANIRDCGVAEPPSCAKDVSLCIANEESASIESAAFNTPPR
jgi:hypothetical protein